MGPHNVEGNNFTVSSMDYLYDTETKTDMCFVVSQPINFNYELTLSIVKFAKIRTPWSQDD
jgi:hypothetical protein